MQNKIFNQLMGCFRSHGVKRSVVLALQMLAWAKLTADGKLSADLALSGVDAGNSSAIKEALIAIGEKYSAFSFDVPLNAQDSRELVDAVGILNQVLPTGLIANLGEIDLTLFLNDARSFDHIIPTELADFVTRLGFIKPGLEVYLPWDFTAQLASNAVSMGAKASLESPADTRIAELLKIIYGYDFEIAQADPIRSPTYVGDGELKKFDLSICIPPFGIRYESDVFDKDWYGRFKERTNSGNVLIIRHLMSVTKDRIVVVVPNSILFSVGAERQLREDLIDRQCLEMVIGLPVGIFEFHNVSSSVLVLNMSKKIDEVKFVDAARPEFKLPIGRVKNKLANLDELVNTIINNSQNDYIRAVTASEIESNGYQLQVNRYILSDKTLKVREYLLNAKTVKLGSLVETVRPIVYRPQEDGVNVYEVSGMDFPKFGAINKPSKETKLDEDVFTNSRKQFLRPYDILIMMKGNAGRVGIVGGNVPKHGPGGWIVGQSCMILRLPEPNNAKALFMQLRSPFGQALLEGVISGATIQLIQLRELTQLEVLSPEDVASCEAAALFDKEVNLQEQILELEKQQQNISSGLWAL